MDLEFLTHKQILMERINIEPHEIKGDDIKKIVSDKAFNNMINVRHRDSYILNVVEIINITDPLYDRESTRAKMYCDITFLANTLDIKSGSILYDCVVDRIAKPGIFLSKGDSNNIVTLVSSDILENEDFANVYKEGDKLDIEIIAAKSTIHDSEIITFGKLHKYKIISSKLLLGNIDKISFREVGNIIKSPTIIDNPIHNPFLGAPTNALNDIYAKLSAVKMQSFFERLCNPYEFVLTEKNYDGGKSLIGKYLGDNISREVLEIIEIYKTFKLGTSNNTTTVNIINYSPNTSDKKIYNAMEKYRKLMNNTPAKIIEKSPDILIIKNDPQYKSNSHLFGEYYIENPPSKLLISQVIDILSSGAKCVIFNINCLTDRLAIDMLYLLQLFYHDHRLFKPVISAAYTLDCYIILRKFKKKAEIDDVIKKLKNINIGDKKYMSSLFENTNDISQRSIRSLRVFNNQLYEFYIEKMIDVVKKQMTLKPDSKEVDNLMEIQMKHSEMWLEKMKFVD